MSNQFSGGSMSKKEPFHEWESKHTMPKVSVQMPTAAAIKSIRQMSTKTEDDFVSPMLRVAGDSVTIKTYGYSFDQAQTITLKIEDARELAKWILEHTE
jgi:hypothetical protein